MIAVTADMVPFMQAMGTMEGITSAIKTDIYVNHVTNYAADQLKEKFESGFLAAAQANPRAYHHVFEWGSLGYHGILQDSGIDVPTPLYALTKRGRGAEKEVGFRFKQSKIQVPLPDPQRSGIPEENIERLKKRAVFRFKAYVMESGMTVHVSPRPGTRRLFVPTPSAEKGFVFSQGYFVQPGKGNAGMFTSFWATWWRDSAPVYMEDDIMPDIERKIEKAARDGLRTIRRGKFNKSKGLMVQPANMLEAMASQKEKMVKNQLIRDQKMLDLQGEREWDEGE